MQANQRHAHSSPTTMYTDTYKCVSCVTDDDQLAGKDPESEGEGA